MDSQTFTLFISLFLFSCFVLYFNMKLNEFWGRLITITLLWAGTMVQAALLLHSLLRWWISLP